MIQISNFHDRETGTLTYLVFNGESKDALIIDPVLNYNPIGSLLSQESLNQLLQFIEVNSLKIHFIMETHVHADHISASAELKKLLPDAKTVINRRIKEVQKTFAEIFDLNTQFTPDGSQFDLLVEDEQILEGGDIKVEVIATPGHTPACTSFRINDSIFTGDCLFMPDSGTGRCDFPGGDASAMYRSIKNRLYSLPDETRVFTGHDYLPGGRSLQFESTIKTQKASNIHLKQQTTEKEYVTFRNQRDQGLNAPKLLYPSIQVNIRAGHLPEPGINGMSYLKIPVNLS